MGDITDKLNVFFFIASYASMLNTIITPDKLKNDLRWN